MGGHYDKSLYNELMEVMARLNSVEKETKQEISRLKNEVSDLKKENRKLREENGKLKEENVRLKNILNHDSTDTSKPPSSDQKTGKPANTYNNREKSRAHRRAIKAAYRKSWTVENICMKLKLSGFRMEYVTRYIIDLKVQPVIREIRIYKNQDGKYLIPKEYRNEVVYGPAVKALAVDLYSEGVMSNDRIASFLNDASEGCLELSEGSIYEFCRKFSKLAEPEVKKLETHLQNQTVVATDATTTSTDGKQTYIRNSSDKDTVVYYGLAKKSRKELDEIPFFQNYSGTLVHDHETALYYYGTEHAECNAHILRYLKKNTEETGNAWSGELASLLREIHRERKTYIEAGETCFPEEKKQDYRERYRSIVEERKTIRPKTDMPGKKKKHC